MVRPTEIFVAWFIFVTHMCLLVGGLFFFWTLDIGNIESAALIILWLPMFPVAVTTCANVQAVLALSTNMNDMFVKSANNPPPFKQEISSDEGTLHND